MTVDADFRCERGQIANIVPYLPEGWREFLRLGDMPGALGSVWALPETIYQSARGEAQAVKADDGKSDIWGRSWATGSDEIADPAAASAFLDQHGIERAVLNPGTAPNLSSLWNPALGAVVASALNDWLIDKWLDADERFLGSIVVGPRDPKAAAAEIERVAGSGRMAQVIIGYPPHLIGNRFFAPVHEAAAEHGLAINLQAGGAYTGGNRGLTGAGFPGNVFEYELGWESGGQPHLLSAVAGGMLERYPTLRLILSGFGIGWLPALLWRMDREFEERRVEIPATLTRLPSEIVHESIGFVTRPDAAPPDLLEQCERVLLYGSGELRRAPDALDSLPPDRRARVLHDNARRMFGLSEVTV